MNENLLKIYDELQLISVKGVDSIHLANAFILLNQVIDMTRQEAQNSVVTPIQEEKKKESK